MSILTELLPCGLMVGGKHFDINADFRTMLKITELSDMELTEDERGREMLLLFYDCIPEEIEEAGESMLWFLRCGKEGKAKEEEESEEPSDIPKADFSYTYDAEYIYAAFLEQYAIDLTVAELHWWKFRALFDALKPEHMFSEIRKCRAIKIVKDMPKGEKAYYRKMKKLYALPLPTHEQEAIDEVTAALMGSGDVMGVLYGEED